MTHTAKHTPGPWVVNADGRMIEAQLPNLRNEYEHICDLRGGIKGQINLGNAHLIAAAPAMYEALREAQELIRSLVAEEMIHSSELQRVGNYQANMWEALAQAEGR